MIRVRSMKWFSLSIAFALIVLSFALVSCSKNAEMEAVYTDAAPPPSPSMQLAAKEAAKPTADMEEGETGMSGEVNGEAPPSAARGRKLIRDGQMKLKVKDVEETRAQLEALVAKVGGFVANVRYDNYSSTRNMELTLRLPATGFDDARKQIAGLGFVENESVDVTDVTDQYVDLERRVQTNEMLAARLEQLIQNKSYQFRDLLEVERELSRLRLDIERLQGSLRGLDDRISLSTLKVSLYQEVIQKVVPPDSVFAPIVSAFENAGPNFKGSLRAMMKLFALIVSIIMVLLPWLVVMAIFTGIVVLFWKRSQKKKK